MTKPDPASRSPVRADARRLHRTAVLAAFVVLAVSVDLPAGGAAFADALRSRSPDAAGSPIPATSATDASGPAGRIAGADPLFARDDWIWPTASPILVEEPFRAPATPYAAGHRGVDLRASAGEPVRAPADGVVSFAGMVAGRPVASIDHGGGLVSSLEPVEASVSAGEAVAAGAVVGMVAAGGHCERRCVHLGVRLHGEYVSPMLYLGGVPRAVLLPW